MSQCLPYQSQVHIAYNQMGSQRVFENVWMALLHRQSGYQGNGLEYTKELGSVADSDEGDRDSGLMVISIPGSK